MIPFHSRFKRVGLACVALGGIAISQAAFAGGTQAGSTINNKATVNYQVNGAAQPFIESSPTGNSTPGLNSGANTQFLVDRKIDLTLQELDGAATTVNPGQTNRVTAFFLRNDGNDTQGFSLSAIDDAIASSTVFSRADAFNATNVRWFVESNACTSLASNGSDGYGAATDTAVNVATLGIDGCKVIYVVADIPNSATNDQASNVTLTAIVRAPTTLAALSATAGADTAGVDVVFADAGNDATSTAKDQYWVNSAALSVQKTSRVVSDPVNLAVNPKAIPGATMEYAIAISNSSTTTAATLVTITDPIPTNTAFITTNPYNSGASNVSITVGVSPATFCLAESGADGNGDGCFRTAGGVLTVGSPALNNIASGGTAVTVRFQVTIN